jgi:hypothetical protein
MTFRPAGAAAVLGPLALVVFSSATLGAAPQGPPAGTPSQDAPVSLDRIREDLARTPRLKLDVPLGLPVATFKVHVEQRVWVPTLQEWLDETFTMTEIQRQSADWASRCCGINLGPLFDKAAKSVQRRNERRIREQITRELADLEAARKNARVTSPSR